jgi:phosphoribosylpyrophosphate synthetase
MARAIQVIAGSSNRKLAQKICSRMGTHVCECDIKRFSDGEVFVQVKENIRGSDVFILQSTSAPANDNLMECLLLIDACKRASSGQITVVIPYYGYSRLDKRQKDARQASNLHLCHINLSERATMLRVFARAYSLGFFFVVFLSCETVFFYQLYKTLSCTHFVNQPISAKLVADLLTAAGANRILTMELRSGQVQGFFDIPLDHLQFNDVLCQNIDAEVRKMGLTEPLVIVAAGKRATLRTKYLAEKLHCTWAVVDGRKGLAEDEERQPKPGTDISEGTKNLYLLGWFAKLPFFFFVFCGCICI